MTEAVNSILINETDNVATAIAELPKGDIGRYVAQGVIVEVVITERIPQYHKFAVRDIRKTDWVRKYGEVIGRAIQAIPKGAHVHVHNIVSPGRNDL
jgi:altronate dehydratase